MSLFHRSFTPLQPYTVEAEQGRLYPQRMPDRKEVEHDLQFDFAKAIDEALVAGQQPAELSRRLGQLIADAIEKKPVTSVDDPVGMYSTLVRQDPESLRILHNSFLTPDVF
jgi:hypothetical protein